MSTTPVDLTIEIRSADGVSTEFYQTDEERIGKTLRLLSTPRLFSQPQLVLASEHGVSSIPCRAIDVILIRTLAPVQHMLPLNSPVGLLDLSEVEDSLAGDDSVPAEDPPDAKPSLKPRTSLVEIHTLGGWVSTLKLQTRIQGTVHDERQSFAHFLDLPVIPYRLEAGGIGLINPSSITRVSTRPALDALPETALSAGLVRCRSNRMTSR